MPTDQRSPAAFAPLPAARRPVNFEEVAPLVGQKYARNARSACKKLFDKLKKNAPPGAVASSSTATGDESAPATPKKTPSKPRKVGAKSTPKKATSAPKGKAVKAEMNDEADAIESHPDEDMKLDFDAE
ncbi:hypothetical protein HYFRA_00000841 [Hymenoscyphus fraxineus]|uniref:Uncharacterized protein n=1 Tax=Hymenoscyphus fraxineus TaxID=746836 RepID=A0A9N9PR44_9HELO|nr:hypothetical protein HYFRA_00000841 [Hymenoscyphus fraxineus]